MGTLAKLTDMLHVLLCDLSHAEQMNDIITGRKPNKCYYYLEEVMDDSWNLDDHKIWVERVEEVQQQLGTTTYEDTLKSLMNILEVVRNYQKLNHKEKEVFSTKFLEELL